MLKGLFGSDEGGRTDGVTGAGERMDVAELREQVLGLASSLDRATGLLAMATREISDLDERMEKLETEIRAKIESIGDWVKYCDEVGRWHNRHRMGLHSQFQRLEERVEKLEGALRVPRDLLSRERPEGDLGLREIPALVLGETPAREIGIHLGRGSTPLAVGADFQRLADRVARALEVRHGDPVEITVSITRAATRDV